MASALRSLINSCERQYGHLLRVNAPQPDLLEDTRKLENSLSYFLEQAWPHFENTPFDGGWHIDALCEHMEEFYKGNIRNLLINVPPRTGKSSLFSVAFPAWCWSKNPKLKFLYVSYALSLSRKHSIQCRRLIQSKWYQDRWGHKFQLLRKNTLFFENSAFGYRIASSVSGANTGEGADFIMADDPNNIKEAESQVVRESTNDWWSGVMSTRLNDKRTGCRGVVQQRCHEQDLSGHILSGDLKKYIHVCLPMEFEKSRRSSTIILPSSYGKIWQDPRKKEGELLWPNRLGPKEIEELKDELRSAYNIAGQLQQRPAPEKGGIIQKDWFQWWTEPQTPDLEFIVQSWDTALSTKADASYSACTTWGVFKTQYDVYNIILLNMWRARVEYPELRIMAKRMANNYNDTVWDDPLGDDKRFTPDMIIVEAKANGLSLIQDLSRLGLVINRFDPTRYGDKVARCRGISHIIEAGRVWLPAKGPAYTSLRPYASELLEACAVFPNSDASKDVVDSMTQALRKIYDGRWVFNPEDYQPEEEMLEYENDRPLY